MYKLGERAMAEGQFVRPMAQAVCMGVFSGSQRATKVLAIVHLRIPYRVSWRRLLMMRDFVIAALHRSSRPASGVTLE